MVNLQISHIIAQKIAFEVTSLIGHNINIFNREGFIVGTTQNERLGEFHQGAYKAIKTGKEITISKDNIKNFKGSKPGINLPLKINEDIIGAVGITGNPDKIKVHGKLTKLTVETMLRSFLMNKQTKIEQRALEIFLYNLLYDQYKENKQYIEYRASLLGINLNLPRVALVINIKQIKNLEKQKEKILAYIRYVLNGNNEYLLAYTGGNNFTLFLPITAQNDTNDNKKTISRISKNIIKSINSNLGLDAVIGVGTLNSKSCYSLKKNFQEASQALSCGEKFHKEGQIHFFDDLGLLLLINNIPSNICSDFIKYIVGNKEKAFAKTLDNTLLITLKVFFDCNLNISEASRALFIHRNTLIYRLDKIRKLTNRDPRIFAEAIELKLLLLLTNSLLKESDTMLNTAVPD